MRGYFQGPLSSQFLRAQDFTPQFPSLRKLWRSNIGRFSQSTSYTNSTTPKTSDYPLLSTTYAELSPQPTRPHQYPDLPTAATIQVNAFAIITEPTRIASEDRGQTGILPLRQSGDQCRISSTTYGYAIASQTTGDSASTIATTTADTTSTITKVPNTTYLGYPYLPPPIPCTTSGTWTVSGTPTKCGPYEYDTTARPITSTTSFDAVNNYTYTWVYGPGRGPMWTTGMCPEYCRTTATEWITCNGNPWYQSFPTEWPVPYTTLCPVATSATTPPCPWCPKTEDFDCMKWNTRKQTPGHATNTYWDRACIDRVEYCPDRLIVEEECMWETMPTPTEAFDWMAW
ncbi:hypothetical protein BJ508DRAFT_329502 [Ascobolus immersus RN42]|uniref:Uncharacterized protein n=1 Tax=Ascobolus immersus RN42 TaxID=1160509 RepID=A0A3N4HYD9_ASCIM|nr:hypothetical protein BJ508DRAFT_329502 [Ascobolus immersus RN42]